jgi:membrane fusion protein (multidrug efflux system)
MLRSGNTGKIMVPQLRQNVMMIPQSATYEMQSLKFAYVVGDSNKVHSVNITVAPENDGQNYIVTSGLNAGDVVVVEGVGISVKEGMQITPKKSK